MPLTVAVAAAPADEETMAAADNADEAALRGEPVGHGGVVLPA